MYGCIRFTNIKQMLHATGRQSNKTPIIFVIVIVPMYPPTQEQLSFTLKLSMF